MRTEKILSDMNFSLKQVERAKPIIYQLLNGGEVKAVEGDDNHICKLLDMTCGIDYFQCYKNGTVQGVASRFQAVWNGYKPYNTFTIRKCRLDSGAETEFQKRVYAMEHNGVYPHLTMQGYYDGKSGEIISLAIARTADIFDCIKSGEYWINQTRDDKVGQSEFYVVDWQAFKNKGYKIAIYDNYKQ